MRLVPIKHVQEGAVLAKPLYDADGRVLLQRGMELNETRLTRALAMGFKSLYINDEFSTNYIDDMIDPATRITSVKAMKDSFNKFDKFVNANNKGTTSARHLSTLRYDYVSDIKNAAGNIIEELLLKRELMINIQDIKHMEDYLYQHSVNVAVLSVLLGMDLGYPESKLKELAIGALLHDVGYNFVPSKIINKPGPLTRKEKDEIEKHTLMGYAHLSDNIDLSAHIRMIVLQHHEWLDGTGYPNKKADKEIIEMARIVAIADVYDALTSDRPYREALNPNEAIEYLLAYAHRQLDHKLVTSFIKLIIPYPVGTLVKLTDGRIGVVDSLDPDFPLRPLVRMIIQDNSNRVLVEEIDLMKVPNVMIEGVQYELPNYSLGHAIKKM